MSMYYTIYIGTIAENLEKCYKYPIKVIKSKKKNMLEI